MYGAIIKEERKGTKDSARMRDPGNRGQSIWRRAGGELRKGKGRGLLETGDAGRAPCAAGAGRSRWVEQAGEAGRGGSWVLFSRS